MDAICKWLGKTYHNGIRFGPESGHIGILYTMTDNPSVN